MNQIRLGTIGSGIIVHHILDQIKRVDGITLAAVYSRSYEKGLALGQAYGCRNIYQNLDDFLADDAVNTVYIASPNSLHYEQTRKALLSGKHVICEKPFCPTAGQIHELAELAEANHRMLAEAAPTSFLPNYQVLKDALPEIGRVRLVMANYSQYSSRYDQLREGRVTNVFDPAFAGGCLMDINYYNIYLTVALFGKPVSAEYHPNLYVNGIDTSGVAYLQYPDFPAVCIGAKDTWGVNYFQIEGEQGYLYVTDGSNGWKEIRIVTREKEETVNLQPDPDRYFYEVQMLARLLQEENAAAFRERMKITEQAIETVQLMRCR